MELYLNATSPYARLVRIVLLEKGLMDAVTRRSLPMPDLGPLLLPVLAVVTAMLIGLVFSMAANERRREIAVLRALGATRFFVFRIHHALHELQHDLAVAMQHLLRQELRQQIRRHDTRGNNAKQAQHRKPAYQAELPVQ
mgnify:CR=1 FL=1